MTPPAAKSSASKASRRCSTGSTPAPWLRPRWRSCGNWFTFSARRQASDAGVRCLTAGAKRKQGENMTPFRIKRRVEFHETDTAQIVHFSNFFRYMECAEVEFLRSLGLSVTMPWESEKIGLPRVSATCDFFKPIRFDEEFEVAVTIARL